MSKYQFPLALVDSGKTPAGCFVKLIQLVGRPAVQTINSVAPISISVSCIQNLQLVAAVWRWDPGKKGQTRIRRMLMQTPASGKRPRLPELSARTGAGLAVLRHRPVVVRPGSSLGSWALDARHWQELLRCCAAGRLHRLQPLRARAQVGAGGCRAGEQPEQTAKAASAGQCTAEVNSAGSAALHLAFIQSEPVR